MNKARRKWFQNVINVLEDQKCELEDIMEEEQEFIDNAPENLACSERYETAEEIVDELNDAISDLEDIISNLNETVEK